MKNCSLSYSVDFTVFLEMWNILQNLDTPQLHYDMASWLQTAWEKGDKNLLLQAFRASGKSTIVGLFSAWILRQDPDLRILILAAESELATKMVRNIRKIIEKHPLTKSLIPKQADQWAADRFTINRPSELRDPSVLGAGVVSNVTGNRADIIIYDDVEVPNTCGSAEKRINLRQRLDETNFILVPNGTQLYVGTPHSYFSIYADKPRAEIREEHIYLKGYKRLTIPVLDNNGQSAWPERFTPSVIKALYNKSGPHKFTSQMMLEPVNIIQSRLDAELLQFYNAEINYAEVQRKLYLTLEGKKIVSCSAWWDPAFGSAKGDKSVVAIIYTDNKGRHYLHHLHYMDIKIDGDQDEATLQCREVIKLIEKYYLPAIHIETNGIGKFLPSILRRELGRKNISCAVVEQNSHKPKHVRILESFDALLAAQNLYVHDQIRLTPFLTEMMEWNQQHTRNADDGLDAVAGALSLEPVRIKNIHSTMARKFLSRSDIQRAFTDFDIQGI